MNLNWKSTTLGLLLSWAAVRPDIPLFAQTPSGNADTSRSSVAVEALSRLENTNLEANPKLKEAVYRVLQQVRGTPDFVRLVKKFNLSDQETGLLEVATTLGGQDGGVEAVRLLLQQGRAQAVQDQLRGTNGAAGLMQALGSVGDQRAVALMQPWIADSERDPTLRRLAVKGLVKYQEGAALLMRAASEGKLAEDLRFTAGSELSAVRWPEVRAAAAKLFPAMETGGGEKLPPLAELLKRKGDAEKGKALFAGKATCATCHQVQGQGVNFGPDLTQVGTKLGKDALYESILDPSAGVSFGYESWLVILKSGDELFGIIASETETDLSIKAPGGVVSSYKKSEIEKRERQKLSVMPAGLQATMTVQEFVDLIEYLASLRKG
jgi:putative heme-binding domain-containing protein